MHLFRRNRSRATLQAEFPPLPIGQAIYAIGDIHGRRDLLDHMHWRIDWDQRQNGGETLEVYLGDYIDRGPDSAGVISRLIARAKNKAVICLKGNHEALFSAFLDGEIDLRVWSRLGGLETLRSYGFDPSELMEIAPRSRGEHVRARLPADHLKFLGSLRDAAQLSGYFFAHAGIRPGVALDQQSPLDLHTIRGAFLDDERHHEAIIIHGHSPCPVPEVLFNRINIDTGAYMTDKLTCLVIDHLGPQFLENRSAVSL
jgi:serine/threonine protein phosphatase 1